MKGLTLLIGLTVVTMGYGQAVDSEKNFGSLVPTKYRSPIASRVARAVGDIITIVIDESASANYSANTSTSKNDSNDVTKTSSPLIDLVKGPVLKRLLGPLSGPPSKLIDAVFGGGSSGAKSSVTGSGTTTSTGKFTSRMAAVVKEILPNGNLVIEGTRWVKVNKDTHSLTLRGVVRMDDVMPDNSVKSENIALAEIRSEGIGQIGDRQRRGILTRIMEWLF